MAGRPDVPTRVRGRGSSGLVGPLIRGIDAINEGVGRASAWLALLLVVVTTYDVIMRYVFRISFVFIQEAEWHIFAVMFLVTAGYAHLKNTHVRVDIIYARLSRRARAWIDFLCGIFFLFPTVFLMVWTSIPFVLASLRVMEGSPDPGGIPLRFILKAVIPVGFLLIGLQGISETIKNYYVIRGREVPT